MTLGDVLEVLRNIQDRETLERLKDVALLLHADLRLVLHSHRSFLPAAREYLRGKETADYRFRAARERRARLGGASRWLYHHQKQTFEHAVHLLCPLHLPQGLVDAAWARIRRAESQLLADSRQNARR